MFMNQALWIPYNSSYFLPCESWLNTSDAATRLEASFYFLSDECFYIAYGILWYCVVYRFKLLTMGEITFTNNKVFYIPIFTMATLFLAVGVFVQAPINLYLNLNFSIFPDLLTIWSKWTYSIHQPLILFFSSIFDTVLSTLVLFQLYTHLSVFSNDNDNNRLGFKRWIIQTLKSRRTQAAVAVRILVYFFIAWISISLVLITVLVTQWICECVNQNQNSEVRFKAHFKPIP